MKSKLRNRLLFLFFALLVLASGIGLLAQCFLAHSKTDAPTRLVYCVEPDYNAGRVKISGESGDAKHVFIVKNDSAEDVQVSLVAISCNCVTVNCPSKIKARSFIEVKATMRIEPMDITFTHVKIDLSLSDNPEEPLKLSFTGAVQPQTTLLTTNINLGDVFVGKEKWDEAKLLWVGKPVPNGVFKEIRSQDNNVFPLRNRKVISEILDDDGKLPLRIEGVEFLVNPKKVGRHSEKASVVLHNGDVLDFTLNYDAQPANVFIPAKYFLSPAMAGSDIMFDFIPSGNTEKLIFSTDCPVLSIDEVTFTGEKHRIKTEYKKLDEEQTGKDFSLWAKNENGQTVATLKLIQIKTQTPK